MSTIAAAPVVSETADDCATIWLAPTNSTVGAELTLPTSTMGATAALGTVTDAAVEVGTTSAAPAEMGSGSGFDSSAADSGASGLVDTDSTGLPAFKDKVTHCYLMNSLDYLASSSMKYMIIDIMFNMFIIIPKTNLFVI